LRYPVKGKLMLAFVALFPHSVWRLLNEQGMKRPAN